MGWSTNGLGRETADVDWASIREAGEGALRRASACVASFTWVPHRPSRPCGRWQAAR